MAEDFDLELSRGRLHVHRFGKPGEVPVLCIPGLSSNSRVFDALGEYRQKRGAGTIAFDLRGRGWSDITAAGTYGWENHAHDIFEAADAMGIEQFDLVGHSMGAFVALAAAAHERKGRIRRAVLIDALGAPTKSALAAIVAGMSRLSAAFPTRDAYVEAVQAAGVVSPWNDYWDRHYRYDLIDAQDGVRPRTSAAAVAEDAAYGGMHNPYGLWPKLTMPALVVRAGEPLGDVPDAFVLTRADYDRFLAQNASAQGREVDANHYGVAVDSSSLRAIDEFLR